MSYIVSPFREEIKQLVVEVIAGLYYCDEEGIELVIAKILSIDYLVVTLSLPHVFISYERLHSAYSLCSECILNITYY